MPAAKVTDAQVKAHINAFLYSTEIFKDVTGHAAKLAWGNLRVVNLLVSREKAAAIYSDLKSKLNFKPMAGEAGYFQNKDLNIELMIYLANKKGDKVGPARAADYKDASQEYFLVQVFPQNIDAINQPVDPAVLVLRGLTDLGGVVKPFEDKNYTGAVVDFPKSLAGTNSVYGGVADTHMAAQRAVVAQVESLAGVAPGTYKSIYKDSFSLVGFYNANPGTPKWFIVRGK
jgi:hypothetical protein